MLDLATSGCRRWGVHRGEGLEVGCFRVVREGPVGWGLEQHLVEGNLGGFVDSFL